MLQVRARADVISAAEDTSPEVLPRYLKTAQMQLLFEVEFCVVFKAV
jgi:hypothetical protein